MVISLQFQLLTVHYLKQSTDYLPLNPKHPIFFSISVTLTQHNGSCVRKKVARILLHATILRETLLIYRDKRVGPSGHRHHVVVGS